MTRRKSVADRPIVDRIVSGGQAGVDRAALDVALALGIPCGGWCPKGRRAEDGPIDPRYPLVETVGRAYAERTRHNVGESDATLVLAPGGPAPAALTGGTRLTVKIARELGRPWRIADPRAADELEPTRAWIAEHGVRVLNVAGPRESQAPGIHEEAASFLRALLSGAADPATDGP